mmetsp:Transcript_18061/g.36388  ORF Transcript_18061/g.36388 Transcript_18061/m.36388 type:complete len:423 (-) Transcript_18061:208-1476(-)|eukprot:CAMPEP_0174721202 /NCGR_PEP_ID=MMETSP1094-20130205/35566_1 /TAXON_ID=156173 /ORGANISM="Chrysochromulina brevifilum, Strain UTEX LB 985" /LENGTH=422 /DNA_ID=CAMNT_0015921839 /DNA_START=94 /DNA_END=1362 /DNA_ORIENTATION=-
MDEEWLTNLLEPSMTNVVTAARATESMPNGGRQPAKRGHGQVSYITPPSMRKTDAVAATAVVSSATAVVGSSLRAPVLAIKVVESEETIPAVPVSRAFTSAKPARAVPRVEAAALQSTAAAVINDWTKCSARNTQARRERRAKAARKANPSPSSPSGCGDGYASSTEAGDDIAPPPIPSDIVPGLTHQGSGRSSVDSSAAADVSALFNPELGNELLQEEFSRDCDLQLRPVIERPSARTATQGIPKGFGARSGRKAAASVASEGGFEDSEYNESLAALTMDDCFDSLGDGVGKDTDRRKVRHNLTERRRVDRMNQLFNRLYMALAEGEEDPLPITRREPPVSNQLATSASAAPKWSKADVLEGALRVITDLRHKLAEERLARSLGVPYGNDFPTVDQNGDGCFVDDDGIEYQALDEGEASML